MGKYELLALLPLTGTDEELKASAQKVAERISAAGGTVQGVSAISRGRLAYPVLNVRQGSYSAIQFEIDPKAVRELMRSITLSSELLRFTISRKDEFKAFVPTPPRMVTRERPVRRVAMPAAAPAVPSAPSPTPTPLAQEPVAPTEAPKVSMEELDKRLEEILGK